MKQALVPSNRHSVWGNALAGEAKRDRFHEMMEGDAPISAFFGHAVTLAVDSQQP